MAKAAAYSKGDAEIAGHMAACVFDPLLHVVTSYPWNTDASIQIVPWHTAPGVPHPDTPIKPAYLKRFPHLLYGPDQWQCEELDAIGAEAAGKAAVKDGDGNADPLRVSVVSGHGIGKAQPLDVEVDTPQGRMVWGDVRPGTYLFGYNGEPTEVIARHDHRNKDIYRVTFDDGSSTLCCGEHVWAVKGRSQRRYGDKDWVTMTTQDLIAAGVKRPNGQAEARQWEIPRQEPVQYPAPVDLDIHPYTLGVWLGDGDAGGRITSADQEVIDTLRSAGEKVTKSKSAHAPYAYGIKGLRACLRRRGLLGKYSYEKSIPSEYKNTPVEWREGLLRGLLDTDGEVYEWGTVGFSSTSEALVDDTMWLVRSLGGKASKQSVKKTTHRDCYRATLSFPKGFQAFHIERKQRRMKAFEPRYLKRWIDRIEYVGTQDAMCVTVAAKDGLYLTNDFIVTHNSTISAWLCKWILDTRPYSVGTMTANTSAQLRTKTWAEVGKWHHLSLTRDWFKYVASTTTMSLTYAKDKNLEGRWKCFAQTCDPNNSEAFAGQHSDSTSFYIFDEASKIDDKLFEVREGGLAAGEPMAFDFGNGTRNTGRFFENCVGKYRDQYIVRSIDSREAYRVNKRKIEQDRKDWGEDSDYFRTRWRGLFPSRGDAQFIPSDGVKEAAGRIIAFNHREDPLVLGVDVARMGGDESVIWPRIGYDCRSFAPRRFKQMDGEELANEVAQYVAEFRQLGIRCRAIAVDAGGGYGGSVIDNLRRMGYDVTPVNPGERAIDRRRFALRVDEMWGAVRDHLDKLALPPLDTDLGRALFEQLTQREYGHTLKEQVRLEPKAALRERAGSPDLADALALTFFRPILPGADAQSGAVFIKTGETRKR